ncbi:hypothetical protein Tco_0370637 [Tanacetum coccineum]
MERIMLTFGGRGTSTQVFLLMRALYSSHITCFQLGYYRAWKGELGMGEEVVTWKLYLGLAFTIPTLERVTIGCCEVDGGGGGGGELFGGGVFGGSVVFSGDGVGNRVRGVVCGVACGVVFGVVKASISMMILKVPEKDRWCGARGSVYAVERYDVDQFGDSSIHQSTLAPQQGASTGGGNVMTHLFARRADLVDATMVPISRIFDQKRRMCLDTGGSDCVNTSANSYRQILHQNESGQRVDTHLVSRTRAHVSETVSMHTQGDMLGHTPSLSLVAPLNHTYLCMDVTKHTIRPQIFSFSDGSMKDGSKTDVNQRSTFSSRTTSNPHAWLVANSEDSLANPVVTTPPDEDMSYIDLGNCDQKCRYCGCLFWYAERLKGAKYDGQPKYHLCCGGEKIYMPQAPEPPLFIRQLLTNNHFMEHIRAYNQMFAMMSFGAKVDDSDKVANRMHNFEGRHQQTLNPQIVEGLVRVLDKNNGLVRLFRTARDRCSAGDIPGMKIRLYSKGGIRGYELLSSDLLGGIVFEDGPKSRTDFDVIIQLKGGPP